MQPSNPSVQSIIQSITDQGFIASFNQECQKRQIANTQQLTPQMLAEVLASKEKLTQVFLQALKQNPACDRHWMFKQREFMNNLDGSVEKRIKEFGASAVPLSLMAVKRAVKNVVSPLIWKEEKEMPIRYQMAAEFKERWPDVSVLDLSEGALKLYRQYQDKKTLSNTNDTKALLELLDNAVVWLDEEEHSEPSKFTHLGLLKECATKLEALGTKRIEIAERLLQRNSEEAKKLALARLTDGDLSSFDLDRLKDLSDLSHQRTEESAKAVSKFKPATEVGRSLDEIRDDIETREIELSDIDRHIRDIQKTQPENQLKRFKQKAGKTEQEQQDQQVIAEAQALRRTTILAQFKDQPDLLQSELAKVGKSDGDDLGQATLIAVSNIDTLNKLNQEKSNIISILTKLKQELDEANNREFLPTYPAVEAASLAFWTDKSQQLDRAIILKIRDTLAPSSKSTDGTQQLPPLIRDIQSTIVLVNELTNQGFSYAMWAPTLISLINNEQALGLLQEGVNYKDKDPATCRNLLKLGLDYITRKEFETEATDKPIDPAIVRTIVESMLTAKSALSGVAVAGLSLLVTNAITQYGIVPHVLADHQRKVVEEDPGFANIFYSMLGAIGAMLGQAVSGGQPNAFKAGALSALAAIGNFPRDPRLEFSIGVEIMTRAIMFSGSALWSVVEQAPEPTQPPQSKIANEEARRAQLAIMGLQIALSGPEFTENQRTTTLDMLEQVLLLKGIRQQEDPSKVIREVENAVEMLPISTHLKPLVDDLTDQEMSMVISYIVEEPKPGLQEENNEKYIQKNLGELAKLNRVARRSEKKSPINRT